MKMSIKPLRIAAITQKPCGSMKILPSSHSLGTDFVLVVVMGAQGTIHRPA